jgi:hypothetical protein
MTQFLRSVQNIEKKSLIQLNQSIIEHSGLRVVLMCGRSVQDFVLPIESEETCIKLESGDLPVFLGIEKKAIKRIYVQITNPIEASLLREWRKCHKISEALHFTAAITRTVGIRPLRW